MRLRLMTAAAAMLFAAAPASAATLTYDFTTNEPFAGGTVAFTYEVDGTVPLDTFIDRSVLTSASAGLARIRFSDACFTFVPGQSASVACDRVEAIVNTGFGTTQLFRLFADGALTTVGTYASLAGTPATLTVTAAAAAVPEPAAWAMLILGTGATGASLRTRRRTSAPARA